mmetsp:Transcript_10892/g.14179  ORF Transcript_10892/g.14179 Transcript_10892/m.14179 type:complete len:202 (-) Transcript_10892:294-899(-)
MDSLIITNRLGEAVTLMNSIPEGKFPLLLSRILQRLHLKGQKLFTQEEENQLLAIFQIDQPTLSLILEGASYMFEQGAYHVSSSQDLGAVLLKAGMDDAHCTAAKDVWEKDSQTFISNLKEQTMGGPKILSNSEWRFHLAMGDSGVSKLYEPCAMFDLTLQDSHQGKECNEEVLTVEYSHSELYDFFQNMETIQEQLDQLV